MSAELKRIRTVKEIRLRREERLLYLKSLQARHCERVEQEFLAESHRSEETMVSIRQRKHERWQELFSEPFDSRKIMHVHDQDSDDAWQLLEMEASLQKLKGKLAQMQAELDQLTANHAQCVRKLEACNELAVWHGRQQSKRNALREEFLADELQGARHGR
ncbi:hypothetical protein [Bordetella genomosp. 4]|uniref:Uncharacterized protein n=1 Tax=Bordetella genomosp. 4 TaxID=463044 RepID=A0A261URN1_9BORD|nr:hypothetical protein [Bordetella genomosp. 4]OZI42380.1 hypothetical protein CAL21_22255 [Bordetella genomosp. 4]OZI64564.1 hypothetical protein CAL20_02595 [Bordetella genomosp. 4]